MSLQFYKVLHLLGLFFVFASLGALTIQAYLGQTLDSKGRRLAGLTHGIALLIVLISGFGALARLGDVGFPGWVLVKLVIWLVIGGIIVLIRKSPQLAAVLWVVLPLLGAFAGYLAIYKPF